MAYLKPQTPLKDLNSGDYFYPLTTIDLVITGNNRLSAFMSEDSSNHNLLNLSNIGNLSVNGIINISGRFNGNLIPNAHNTYTIGKSDSYWSTGYISYLYGTTQYVDRARFGNSSYEEHNANLIITNGMYYYTSNGPSALLGARSTDGSIYCQNFNNNWVSLIAQDYRDGGLYVRGKNNGSWQKWLQVPLVDLSSSVITNCNNVYRTGIYTNGGFANRPGLVSDWGTLVNYKLYESNNLYHRQMFYDCYNSDRIWTRSCSDGSWTDWKMLLNDLNGASRYSVGDTGGCSYILVTINHAEYWMLNFTLKVYSSYRSYDILISGYNYGTNHWYDPNAQLLGSNLTAVTVYFGYTDTFKLWVAIPGGSYDGASICDFCNGYVQVSPINLFTISKVSSLPGTILTILTANRQWIRGESVTSAVWNDYAEARCTSINVNFGQVLMEAGDDTLVPTTERLSHFAGIASDTWGFSQGETETAKTPIAVAGRVLAYPYRDRNEYKPGDCLCAAPNGTVDIMTREEVCKYPDRIVGTVSCVPTYEEWGGGKDADREPVKVNGRIWVHVR